MRSKDGVWAPHQLARKGFAVGEGLDWVDVDGSSAQMSAAEGMRECGNVNHRSATGVDEE